MKTNKSTLRLTCAQYQAALEFYIDAEIRGASARKQFPALARHLRTCVHCAKVYHLLRDASPTDAPPALGPRALAFLPPAPAHLPWTTQVRGRIGGARLGVRFDLPASILRGLFTAPQYAVMRGADEPERALLLNDTVRLGTTDATIELWLIKPSQPHHGVLDISVSADTPLPEPTRITIRWKGFRYTKTLKEGHALIGKIDIDSLQTAPSLRVDFEAGTHGATLEDYRGIR